MTRIIAGSHRGRRLRTPTGDRTRPTSDRVREALFSAVEASLGSLSGLRVLDLYAGSGAVGLEAISRGASAATLVESDRRTALLVADNARALAMDAAEVVTGQVERVLAAAPRAPYDVVFADPPYPLSQDDLADVLAMLVDQDWLTEAAAVVVERSKRSAEPVWPAGLTGRRSKRYGETVLWWAEHTPGSTPEA